MTKLTIFFEPSATAALGRPYTPCPKHGAVVLLKDAMSAWPRWNGVVRGLLFICHTVDVSEIWLTC